MSKQFYLALVGIFCICFLFSCQQQQSMELKTGRISAGGFQVYYEDRGKGEPVLFIHAGLQNSSMWKEQAAALEKALRVITIDLPFHGKTIGTDTSILAKDVIRIVLDSLQIPKVSVAGLSMGAAVAQDFVLGYPQRVHKAVFMASGLNGYEVKHGIDSVSIGWYKKFMEALQVRDTARAALEFTKAWGEGIDQKGDELTKQASKYVYQTTLLTLRQHQLQGWPNLQDSPTAFDKIATIKCPVLIIHGDKDLPFIDVASRFMEKNIAGAKRVLLKNAAHMLNLEQPAEVNRLLTEFLKN